MDFHFDALKSIDDPVIDRVKKVVDESIKQLSRNVHNILKLLKKIQEACGNGSSRNPSLRDVFKPVKLENWLCYFENLSRKISNSFADIVNHLHNLMDDEERNKLHQVLPNYDGGYSLNEIINAELPQLKEEIAFLLGFISYPNRQLAGILEQHQRPDGGTHIISKSIATTPVAVSNKYQAVLTDISSESLVIPKILKPNVCFEITGQECIDISKFPHRDVGKSSLL